MSYCENSNGILEETYDVDITKLVQPEIMRRCCCSHKVTIRKMLIYFSSSDVQLV